MLLKPNTDTVATSTLVGPDGDVLNKPVEVLTYDEARTMREYKKILMRHHWKEAIFCERCFSGNRSDGTRAHVTDQTILVECRCRDTIYNGQTI